MSSGGAAHEFLVQLGQNPLAVGILAVFGILAGIEQLIKYVFRSARLLKLAAELGSKRAARMYRRQLQINLRSVRELRLSEGLKSVERNARSHRQIAFVACLFGVFVILTAITLDYGDPTLLFAGFLGGASRVLMAALLSFPAVAYARAVSRDPKMWRQKWIDALKRTKR